MPALPPKKPWCLIERILLSPSHQEAIHKFPINWKIGNSCVKHFYEKNGEMIYKYWQMASHSHAQLSLDGLTLYILSYSNNSNPNGNAKFQLISPNHHLAKSRFFFISLDKLWFLKALSNILTGQRSGGVPSKLPLVNLHHNRRHHCSFQRLLWLHSEKSKE